VLETKRALDQIAEIHGHLARGEVYRDYRALPVAMSGAGAALGLAGPEAHALLPGLWSILFALGVFASRPYLPRNTGGWLCISWSLDPGCC
jgi:hypothetical protein